MIDIPTIQPTEPQKSVLLVDDDKFLLDMYTMKFVRAGYAVSGSISVDGALEQLRKGFPADAVVFDLIMPEKDGFALLEALRDEKLVPHAIKIALTNQTDDSDRSHAAALGADACYVKATMIPSEVVNMVGTEIAKRTGK